MKENSSVRKAAKDAGVKHWQIALELGISEQTFMRWLRTPLPEEKELAILSAISRLTKGEC